jgi:hypothetical protein
LLIKLIKLVKLSLKLGADPNIIDQYDKTLLHRLAADYRRLPEHLPLFKALVDARGHLDMATFNGDTVLDILQQSLQYVQANSQILGYSPPRYYVSLLNTVLPLSCYCVELFGSMVFRLMEDGFRFVSKNLSLVTVPP